MHEQGYFPKFYIMYTAAEGDSVLLVTGNNQTFNLLFSSKNKATHLQGVRPCFIFVFHL
jgi:hypothetical protein